MITLQGQHIKLRALEPADIELLLSTENNEDLWHLSQSITPLSRHQLEEYILNSSADFYEVKQLRLVISSKDNTALGFIDLFDFDPRARKAGVGIVISNSANRRKGFGKEALLLLIGYAFKRLNLHQLYCNILESNSHSLRLFEDVGFNKIGLKQDWSYQDNSFENEWFLQLLNNENVH